MLKIYDLHESYTEDEIDDVIKKNKDIPTDELSCNRINTVVEYDSDKGSFYLAENVGSSLWWFGPRTLGGIASPRSYKWFCFRTEDGKYHKFEMINIAQSREAMAKILKWIAKGKATDEPTLNLTFDQVEFMDI